ncbi:MAG: BON domain-containing protein [Alphaproteobacteria bacterium]|nr:BON domain-containing protein [Alphaproteobacteria bacterium]
MRTSLLVAMAVGACALQSGCAAVGGVTAATMGMATGQDRSVGRSIDDAAASAEMKRRLQAFDRQAYAHVDVEVAQGQLLLSGTTPRQEDKDYAERIAWNVRTIESVSNQIIVGASPGMVRSSQDNFITAQVRTKLMADAQIKSVNFNVETQQGVVYLMGLARSDEELQRAAEIASLVGGVQKVVSYVLVRPTDSRTRQTVARNPDAEVPALPSGAPIISATN